MESFDTAFPVRAAEVVDSGFDKRVVLEFTTAPNPLGVVHSVFEVFPPMFRRTTDNKHTLCSHLDTRCKALRDNGDTLVGVHWDGSPIHSHLLTRRH